MDVTTRVATLMLRRSSRKDISALGTLFSQWSAGGNPRTDPMRRMTMGGAGPMPDAQPPQPAQPAVMDAFCAVQLAPTSSIGGLSKQDSAFLLSPVGSLGGSLLTPRASIKDATNTDGAVPLSPSLSAKGGLGALLSSPSFKASAEALLQNRVSVAGAAAPSPLSISS